MSMIFHKSHIWNICDVCENFHVAGTIRRQVKSIHKNQKDFISSYCGKSFTQAVNLMKTIDEDKRYLKCESCGSSFSNFHHLRVHNYISKTFMNLRKILNMILVDNEVQSWYSCMYCLCIYHSKKYTFHKQSRKIWNKCNIQKTPPYCSWRHLDFSQIKCEFCDKFKKMSIKLITTCSQND